MFDIVSLITTPFQEKLLALTHTEEYLLKIYDLAATGSSRNSGGPTSGSKGSRSQTRRRRGAFLSAASITPARSGSSRTTS